MSPRMACCVTGSQISTDALVAGWLLKREVSLFSHAFAPMGSYTFSEIFSSILSILFLFLETILHV